jgi:hypothetical protein
VNVQKKAKKIGRGIVQLPPLCWGCEAECPSICKFLSKKDAGTVQSQNTPLVRMRRRFNSSCRLQPLKHWRRCSRLVSGRAGFDSSQGHQSQCCVSSFGRAPSWYLGGARIEATTQHHFAPFFRHVPIAQLAEALPSEGRRWGFESSSGHQHGTGARGIDLAWFSRLSLPRATAAARRRRRQPIGESTGDDRTG